ncbi:unnamed protein product [Hermetia illucens]|uniref:Carbohydrate kinase PfkB domain-containing protein n=1 Tax=Hermetia illucens TaxID=343691 RepID=A0A7R8V586_HERIL|nr:unnamed protein product [Hermetia illucens]
MRIADKPYTLPRSLTNQIKFISPNIYELQKIAQVLNTGTEINEINMTSNADILRTAKNLARSVIEHFDTIIVTLGPLGVLIASKSTTKPIFNNQQQYSIERGPVKYRHYLAPKLDNLVNVSGAGDSFTSGFISAMLSGATEDTCVAIAFQAAQCALKSESAVPDKYFQGDEEKQKWYAMRATAEELTEE